MVPRRVAGRAQVSSATPRGFLPLYLVDSHCLGCSRLLVWFCLLHSIFFRYRRTMRAPLCKSSCPRRTSTSACVRKYCCMFQHAAGRNFSTQYKALRTNIVLLNKCLPLLRAGQRTINQGDKRPPLSRSRSSAIWSIFAAVIANEVLGYPPATGARAEVS